VTEVLVIVGVLVSFISVFGAVMVGRNLREEPERAEPTPERAPVAARLANTASSPIASA
jgi:hypothetical protein